MRIIDEYFFSPFLTRAWPKTQLNKEIDRNMTSSLRYFLKKIKDEINSKPFDLGVWSKETPSLIYMQQALAIEKVIKLSIKAYNLNDC